MSTRAQRFKAEAVRTSNPPRPPKRPRTVSRSDAVDTAAPGISATDRKAGAARTGERNRAARAGRKAGFALESADTPRPSRKSKRRGKNRAKPDSNLRRRQTRRVGAPKTRARRASVAKKK